MDTQVSNFLKILRRIFDCQKELMLEEPVDWFFLSNTARKQNLLPLFFEAAIMREDYQNSKVYEKDQLDAFAMVAAQIQRSNAFVEIYKKITTHGIYPIVMKGIVCRQLYGGLGEHRPSGDEDILVEIKDFYQVKTILEQEGFECEIPNVSEKQLTQFQEVTFHNFEEKLMLEVHTNIIGIENNERVHMNDFFKNVHEHGQMIQIYGTEYKTLEPTEALLFLILHTYKHFKNRGVGIRQMMDVLLYYKEYREKISIEQLVQALKTCNAEMFWNDILYIGNQYLGLCEEHPEFTCYPEELLQDMINSGVFGKNEKMDYIAERVNIGAQGGCSKVFRAIFPPRIMLVGGRPYLADRPWLLPVAWVDRWIKFLRYAGKDVWKISSEILEKSSARMRIIEKYKK